MIQVYIKSRDLEIVNPKREIFRRLCVAGVPVDIGRGCVLEGILTRLPKDAAGRHVFRWEEPRS